MWLMPCSSSSSSVRSASRLETAPSAAAPKMVRDDSWPVAPKGARSIMPGAYACGRFTGARRGGAQAPPRGRRLRRRVGVRPAEDVGVPEVRRALLLDVGRIALVLRDRIRIAVPGTSRLLRLRGLLASVDRLLVQRLAVAVDGVAVRRSAHVVPDAGAVRVRRGGVDVVTEELRGEVVLRRATRVARLAAVNLRERGRRPVRVEDDAHELPVVRQPDRAVAERCGERVVDHPDVLAVR